LAHHADQSRLDRIATAALARAERSEARSQRLEGVAARLVDTLTVQGRPHTRRSDSGRDLIDLLARSFNAPRAGGDVVAPVGSLGGLDLELRGQPGASREVRIVVADAEVEAVIGLDELAGADPSKLVQRLERLIERIPETAAAERTRAGAERLESAQAASRLGLAFTGQATLDNAAAELARLDEELKAHTLEPVIAADDAAEQGPSDVKAPYRGRSR